MGLFSYERRYLEDPDVTITEARENAIRDTKEYLGEERFETLVNAIKYEGRYPRNIRMIMGFLCGIEGFTVKVLIQRYHPVSIRLFGVDAMGRNVRKLERR